MNLKRGGRMKGYEQISKVQLTNRTPVEKENKIKLLSLCEMNKVGSSEMQLKDVMMANKINEVIDFINNYEERGVKNEYFI